MKNGQEAAFFRITTRMCSLFVSHCFPRVVDARRSCRFLPRQDCSSLLSIPLVCLVNLPSVSSPGDHRTRTHTRTHIRLSIRRPRRVSTFAFGRRVDAISFDPIRPATPKFQRASSCASSRGSTRISQDAIITVAPCQ